MPRTASSRDFSYASPDDARWRRAVIHRIELITGKPRLWRLYRDYCNGPPADNFFAEAVARLDLRVRVNQGGLATIPAHGPLVVVANHPFGVVDGLTLGYLVSAVRPDFKILVNSLLYRLPELRPHLLPIDFAETPEARRTNLASRRAALEDLAAGRAIALFPGGTVSTAERPLGAAVDPSWKPFVARLIHESRATVVTVYFGGQNSRLFQLASRFSMTLRLSLLFREVVNKMGREIEARIAPPIPYAALAGLTDRNQLAAQLRAQTYAARALPGGGLPPLGQGSILVRGARRPSRR